VPLQLDIARGPRRTRGLRQRVLAGLALVMAIAALGGALGLVSGAVDLGSTVDRRLPFDSPVFGGAALTAVVAVPMAVTAWMAWRAHPRAARTSELAAVMLVAWIGVQLLLIRQFSFLQPICAGVGLVVLALAWNDGTHRHPA
jgi:hypothetical protein